jgi:hypothetical protein
MASKRKRRRPARRVWVKAHCRRRPEAAWLKNHRKSKAMPF